MSLKLPVIWQIEKEGCFDTAIVVKRRMKIKQRPYRCQLAVLKYNLAHLSIIGKWQEESIHFRKESSKKKRFWNKTSTKELRIRARWIWSSISERTDAETQLFH